MGARPRARGVRLFPLVDIREARSRLLAAETGAPLPFVPRRWFVVMDVPSTDIRGEHAHRKLEQMLICIKGEVCVMVDDGRRRRQLRLDDPGKGLYIPPMVWAAQYNYSADAVLLVLASAAYDARDYIRDYEEFLGLLARRRRRR